MRVGWSCLGILLALSGCLRPELPPASNVSELAPDERVIVGKVVVEDDLRTYTHNFFRGATLFIGYGVSAGQPVGAARGEKLGDHGGYFHVRVKQLPLYVVSLDAHYLFFEEFVSIPLRARASVTNDRCDYIGTFVVSRRDPGSLGTGGLFRFFPMRVEVRDDFAQDGAAAATRVAGCEVHRAIASPIPFDEWERLYEQEEASRPRPPGWQAHGKR